MQKVRGHPATNAFDIAIVSRPSPKDWGKGWVGGSTQAGDARSSALRALGLHPLPNPSPSQEGEGLLTDSILANAQEARLPLLVGIRFQVSFTPLVGVLFTFPSRYLFTIGHRGVLRLGGWSPHVQTGFHVSRPTRGHKCAYPYGAITLFGAPFQTLPVRTARATGLVRVRSPLLTESRLMSFPPATEMFQFAGFASRGYGFTTRYR